MGSHKLYNGQKMVWRNPELTHCVLDMKARAQKCIDANGGHYEKKRGVVTIVCHIEVAETSWLKSKKKVAQNLCNPTL